MKKVMLTGSSGFVGRHAIPFLIEKGYEVYALDIQQNVSSCKGVTFCNINVFDSQKLGTLIEEIQPSHLLHFAWCAQPGVFWSSPQNIQWTQQSLFLLQKFVEQGGKRVVMAGSCAEYDWRYGYCCENVTPLAPATLYGSCKHALHTILDSYSKRHGLSSAWGRLFFLYGPHEYPERLVSSIIYGLLKKEQVSCSSGEQVRDYMHVKDAARAFVMLLDSSVTGAVNIASGIPIRVKELILLIAEQLNQRHLPQFGAFPPRIDDPPLLTANVKRLRKEVKFIPEFNVFEGIQNTIEYWKLKI